jgi:hypothetical protein
MVKIKMFLVECYDDLEQVVNQWLENNHINDIVEFRYQRDPKCFSAYSACVVYKKES